MALQIRHKEIPFGIGDGVKVYLRIKEGEKSRVQIFEGMVISIKGRVSGKSFTVRKIGAAKIGVEMIFPIDSPSVEKIEVVKKGMEGVKHAKLYYTRHKSSREVERIYSRVTGKNAKPQAKKKKAVKAVKTAKTKVVKKTKTSSKK